MRFLRFTPEGDQVTIYAQPIVYAVGDRAEHLNKTLWKKTGPQSDTPAVHMHDAAAQPFELTMNLRTPVTELDPQLGMIQTDLQTLMRQGEERIGNRPFRIIKKSDGDYRIDELYYY